MSWLRPARGCSEDTSKAPGVMNDETSSDEGVFVVNVGSTTLPAGSWSTDSELELGEADCVAFLPVKTSHMPILRCALGCDGEVSESRSGWRG